MLLNPNANILVAQNEMCKHQALCDGQCFMPPSPRPSRSCNDDTLITSSPTTVDAFPVEDNLIPKLSLDRESINRREETKKQVSFSELSVREYTLVVADRTSDWTAELGWNVQHEYSEGIEIYESKRSPRRFGDELILRRQQKKERLKMAMSGLSEMEHIVAKREQQLRERREFFCLESHRF